MHNPLSHKPRPITLYPTHTAISANQQMSPLIASLPLLCTLSYNRALTSRRYSHNDYTASAEPGLFQCKGYREDGGWLEWRGRIGCVAADGECIDLGWVGSMLTSRISGRVLSLSFSLSLSLSHTHTHTHARAHVNSLSLSPFS